MKFTEWINYWIQNPEHCTFIMCIVNHKTIYIIHYKSPYTGRTECLVTFSTDNSMVIECRSEKCIGKTTDLLLAKFEELALNNFNEEF